MNSKTLILLFFFCTSALVFAENSTSTEAASHDSDDHQVNRRRFEIKVEADKVELEGRSENPNFEDRLEVDLETNSDDGRLFEIEVRYRTETNSAEDNRLRFRFRLESILEWLDASLDGVFNSGEEIFTYTGPKSWSAWTQSSSTDGTATTYDFTTSTTDGVITLVAHVASGQTGTYDANGVKFDLAINNFPFTSPNSTGLAFITRLITESRVDDNDPESSSAAGTSTDTSTAAGKRSDGEHHVEITQDSVLDNLGVLGQFLWVNALETSNGQVVVHAGSPTKGDGNYELVFWVNDHSNVYAWDPELRVEYTGSASALSSWMSWFF